VILKWKNDGAVVEILAESVKTIEGSILASLDECMKREIAKL
jgi:hypothetical protein